MNKICSGCFREKTGDGQCPYCGYGKEADREKYPQALPCDTILAGRYILGKVLGQGGFGITYLGQDYKTEDLAAIKEFFPEPMAARVSKGTVAAYTGERGSGFQYGKDFLQEARTLAEFKGNDNIVRIHCFFEENGTAYFVMDYVDGVGLQRYVKDRGGRLPWREAVDLMLPVLYALAAVQ
ncbi:protein kinase domain-containing protein [uncultured Dysosmobacter sp.]|uniref:serine/threonine protein kinase n=1 Tax=uncultured Dysosmobacter sp. TaxID=2591384 RepID=UPI002615A530|nr:protein kinase [uncultured Dysosmobacter sp.]